MKVLILLLLVSCTHKRTEEKVHFRIEVDSISSPKASGKKFTLVSGDKNIPNNDLRFLEFAAVAQKALVYDGFIHDSKKPDVKIVLTYGIGEPVTTTLTSSVPVYGYTNSNINGAWGQNLGTVQTFGYKGDRTSSQSYDNYKRTIVLRAVSAKSGEPVWETVITSTGGSNDLRDAFPYLMLGGASHYGTSAKAKYKIDEDNAIANSFRP